MSKKMGRPTDDPKTIIKKTRISEKDAQKLKTCSQLTGKTESEIIRMGIDAIFKTLARKGDAE
ncbi:MAG: hypothetical protein LIO94_01490 [Clostridiales bacterium]|nr:hypothetical protein [Clostridiales bacterium]